VCRPRAGGSGWGGSRVGLQGMGGCKKRAGLCWLNGRAGAAGGPEQRRVSGQTGEAGCRAAARRARARLALARQTAAGASRAPFSAKVILVPFFQPGLMLISMISSARPAEVC
jgi:hypothetical protein